uniref:NADH dehydrogenase subunit 3 n=1 Tax=Euplotes cristatus TaxID=756077 RepID=UPI002E77E5B6|nr:NADH dehydrogenase subunit 3 [Euplotes cristatus]UPM52084.1 NADH dehydrogenase subunit 3 [Euplotes cristatus]
MGSFEVIHFWILTCLLIVVIVGALSVFSFKALWNRFGLLQPNRREFYECGFKPVNQKPVRFSIQFAMVCFFFLIYDIELAFSYPLVSSFGVNALTELLFFIFLYGTFLISLFFDFDRNLTDWRLS